MKCPKCGTRMETLIVSENINDAEAYHCFFCGYYDYNNDSPAYKDYRKEPRMGKKFKGAKRCW